MKLPLLIRGLLVEYDPVLFRANHGNDSCYPVHNLRTGSVQPCSSRRQNIWQRQDRYKELECGFSPSP